MQMSSATTVVYVLHAAANATKEIHAMTYEPPLEDDIALDKDIEDDSDVYTEPDRMWGDE
jgi:hypothetical protein